VTLNFETSEIYEYGHTQYTEYVYTEYKQVWRLNS
jgi:hypothetical protein